MARNTVTPFVSVNLKQLEIYIHISVCVCVYIYIHICTHICTYICIHIWLSFHLGFPGGSDSKKSTCNVGDLVLNPGLGRSSEKGNSCPLQYSCLENPMERGDWQATVHGVAKSQTWPNDFYLHFSFEVRYRYLFHCKRQAN